MKTSKSNNSIMKNNFLVLSIILSSLIFLASCKKETLLQPKTVPVAATNDRLMNPAVDSEPMNTANASKKKFINYQSDESESSNNINSARINQQADVCISCNNPAVDLGRQATQLIKIDHSAGRSHNADYAITVFSDASVVFEGRRNVATLKSVRFKISDSQFKELISLFESRFNTLKGDQRNLADGVKVITSYNSLLVNVKRSNTLVDYNDGSFKELEKLRATAESILQISSLIYKHDVVIASSDIQ